MGWGLALMGGADCFLPFTLWEIERQEVRESICRSNDLSVSTEQREQRREGESAAQGPRPRMQRILYV